jgi:hypothetical protein
MSAVRRESPVRSPFSRRRALLLIGAGLANCLAGCDTMRLFSLNKEDTKVEKDPAIASALALPGKNQFRIAPYVFCHDFDVKHDQPVFQDLENLRDQVYKELHLPPGTSAVKVYLFENEERYDRYMKAKWPHLPHRRAFFMDLGTLGRQDLVVFVVWGERLQQVQQDLRHELTHALLNSVLKHIPLWLDEGLAEYFEVPPDRKGVNATHLEMLCHPTEGTFKPDLAHLEAIGPTELDKMNRPEYREAWAWVHLMLRSKPEAKAVLITYLQQLRPDREPDPLGPDLAKVFPSPEEALEKHLTGLEDAERAANRVKQ